jgi:hypothetical protein
MKWLKTYKQHNESIVIDLQYQSIDLMESLNIWHDVLLNAISAEELDIFDKFSLPKDMYSGKLDLDYLVDNIEFINSLSSIGLKKSAIQNTDDHQTFLNKPCKFMFVYNAESNELENPVYIIFQVWNETLNKWEDVKLYKVNDDVKKFYDKLSSKTIEIIDGDENYIYQTSNGSDWELQNLKKENDIYQRYFRKEQLQQLLSDRNIKLTII